MATPDDMSVFKDLDDEAKSRGLAGLFASPPPEEQARTAWRGDAASRQAARGLSNAFLGIPGQVNDAITRGLAVKKGEQGRIADLRRMFAGEYEDTPQGRQYGTPMLSDPEAAAADAELAPIVGPATELVSSLSPLTAAGQASRLSARAMENVPRLFERPVARAAETLVRGATTGAGAGAAYEGGKAAVAGRSVGEAAGAGAIGGAAFGGLATTLAGAGAAASRAIRNPSTRAGEMIRAVERVGGRVGPTGVRGGEYDVTSSRQPGTRTELGDVRQGPKATEDIARGRELPSGQGSQRGVAHDIVDDMATRREMADEQFRGIENRIMADQGTVEHYPRNAIQNITEIMQDANVNETDLASGKAAGKLAAIGEALSGGNSGRPPTIAELVKLRRLADKYADLAQAKAKGAKAENIPWIGLRTAIAEDIADASSQVARTDRSGLSLGQLYRDHHRALTGLETEAELLLKKGGRGGVRAAPEERGPIYEKAANQIARTGMDTRAAASAEKRMADLIHQNPEYGPGIDRVKAAAAGEGLRLFPQDNTIYPVRRAPVLRVGKEAALARLADPAARAVSRANPATAGVQGGALEQMRRMAAARDAERNGQPDLELSPEDEELLRDFVEKGSP